MGYIKVRKANCKNCYKCLKNCIVKSIMYKDEKVEILEDRCILCGVCITTCPQRAKKLDNDLTNVKEYIENPDIKTVVSLDPSYIAAFGENSAYMAWAIKQLGFDLLEETAIGAEYVTREYLKLIKEGKMDNIIASACPSVNMFIEKYYPELTDCIAPVLSPALAHGKLIKERMGEDVKVIHIGPCLSRIKEAEESKWVDAVVTFQQLKQWLMDENITPNHGEIVEFDRKSGYSRIYPIVDGIVYDLKHQYGENNITEKIGNYDLLSASGLGNIKHIFEEMRDGNIKNAFVEALSCYGGCIHGPFIDKASATGYKARIRVKNYADAGKNNKNNDDLEDLSMQYKASPVVEDMPSEQQIREILAKIGKNSKAQELNCGSCGYSTCREKAIAVYQQKAELYICMPYMTDINQAMSSVTLNLSPNYIIAVDSDMNIKEFNAAAQRMFNVTRENALNKKLSSFIDTTDFEQVINNKSSIYDKKVKYADYDIVTEQTIIYSDERNMAIAIIKDVTNEEKEKEKLYNIKLESVEMAQNVIDKQMVVAQQIASLLGETTAETKVTLNKLKNLIYAEDEY